MKKLLLRVSAGLLVLGLACASKSIRQDQERTDWFLESDACVSTWGQARLVGANDKERALVLKTMSMAYDFNLKSDVLADREPRLLQMLSQADQELEEVRDAP